MGSRGNGKEKSRGEYLSDTPRVERAAAESLQDYRRGRHWRSEGTRRAQRMPVVLGPGHGFFRLLQVCERPHLLRRVCVWHLSLLRRPQSRYRNWLGDPGIPSGIPACVANVDELKQSISPRVLDV